MPVSRDFEVTKPKSKSYELLPKDVYHCEVLSVDNKKKPSWEDANVLEDKIEFTFVAIEDGDHYGRRLWKDVNPILSKYKGGSTLYLILVALNKDGKEFTDEEVADIEKLAGPEALNNLVGKQIRLTVGQKEKKSKPGEFYNAIESFLPVKKDIDSFSQEKSDEKREEILSKKKEETPVADIIF